MATDPYGDLLNRRQALGDIRQLGQSGIDELSKVPAPAVQPRRKKRKKTPWHQDDVQAGKVWKSLIGKSIKGADAPGEGIVPYAAIPRAAREYGPQDEPVVGWDPKTLSKREKEMLALLMQRQAQEDRLRQEQEMRQRLAQQQSQQQSQQQPQQLASLGSPVR